MHDEQFKRGVEEFNRCYFFECHDTLEELWMETIGRDRLFLQGLIQVSVGFYHLFNKNYKGASSQFMKGLEKLEAYRPAHRGIEIDHFLEDVRRWHALVERCLQGHEAELDESGVPKLQFIE